MERRKSQASYIGHIRTALDVVSGGRAQTRPSRELILAEIVKTTGVLR